MLQKKKKGMTLGTSYLKPMWWFNGYFLFFIQQTFTKQFQCVRKVKGSKTVPYSQRAHGLGQKFSNILISGPY